MDAPVDTWYALVGVALVSTVVFGTATSLPTRPPPDAAAVADTVDRTAVAASPATSEHPVAADQLRVGPRRITLRNGAGQSSARFAFGPVAPVTGETRLTSVLRGAPPSRVFEDPHAYRAAVRRARERDPSWQHGPETLVVRHVRWGETDVTLVGA
jgi:hypothetical protein